MTSSQVIIPLLTGALGLALGLALAPNERKENTTISELPARKLTNRSTAEADSIRTLARDREQAPKTREPRVSIPLKNIVEILKAKKIIYNSTYNPIEDRTLSTALVMLNATKLEQDEIMKLFEASKNEILAARHTHAKLGEVTADKITIGVDISGMRGPSDEIAGRTKEGIRAILPADLAEGLISAIDWKMHYDPSFDTSFTQLEITRNAAGELTRRESIIYDGGASRSSQVLNRQIKDDGTPLSAGLIFGDRWKPLLKGVTILPKNEE